MHDSHLKNAFQFGPEDIEIFCKAVENGDIRKAEEMLQAHGSGIIYARDNIGATPCLYAIWRNRPHMLEFLLRNGGDANEITLNDMPLLAWAVSDGLEGIVKLLLENGADASMSDGYGRTAMDVAVEMGRTEAAATLRNWMELRRAQYERAKQNRVWQESLKIEPQDTLYEEKRQVLKSMKPSGTILKRRPK